MGERQSDSGSRSQLVEHVRFFAELGVKGLNQSEILVSSDISSDTEQVLQNSPTTITLSGRGVMSTKSLQSIRNELGECTRCKLHELGRQQIVFGVGGRQQSQAGSHEDTLSEQQGLHGFGGRLVFVDEISD